jgi:hypothetical protein
VARRFGADDIAAGRAGSIGAYTSTILLTAVPPTLIGNAGRNATGSYLAALVGSALGALGSFTLVRLNHQGDNTDRRCRIVCAVSFVGVVLLPGAGAAGSYNLSRRRSH